MKPDLRRRVLYFITLFLDVSAVVLISISLATNYWVVAKPDKLVDEKTLQGAKNVTGGNLESKFKGYINFGLFNGYKELDHGLGIRTVDISFGCVPSENVCGWVPSKTSVGKRSRNSLSDRSQYIEDILKEGVNATTDHNDLGLFNFGLWLSTIFFAACSILMGLVAAAFTVLNISMKPIETINGHIGLYLWNSIAGFLSIVSLLLYLCLFLVDYRHNVLSPEDQIRKEDQDSLWTSSGRADLHYSFYLLVLAALFYLCNVLLLKCFGQRSRPCLWCWFCQETENVDVHRKTDADMMF